MPNLPTRIFAALSCATALLTAVAAVDAAENLTAETASPGNSPHLSIIHLADVLSKEGIADLQVQEGQTLTNSIVNVAEGKTDISAMPIILHFLLEKGAGPFSKQGENGAALAANLQALWPYNAGAYGMLTFDSTGIRSWSDIKGRTVFNGPPRGAALVNARQAITVNTGFEEGTDYNGIQANWGQLTPMMLDGSADAFVLPMTFPYERAIVMLSAGNVNIISTPKDVYQSEGFQKLLKAPGNIPMEVAFGDMGYENSPGIKLISEDGVYRGMGTAFADVVHKDMDKGLVKSMTATYIAAMDDMRAKAPYVKNIGLGNLDATASGFCGPLSLKYHPGAVEAWEEAGVTVPDCAK
jgi:TRAP-type uncharacterized transport system substrate-binding protein